MVLKIKNKNLTLKISFFNLHFLVKYSKTFDYSILRLTHLEEHLYLELHPFEKYLFIVKRVN